AAQLVHHDFAHFARGDLPLTEAAQLVADATDRLLDRFLTDRPLLECLAHAGPQLRLIERLARTIALHDERHGELGRLERREALAAGETLAAAADLTAFTREARVGDLRLDVAAEGTVHAALRKWGSRDEPNRSRSGAGGAQALGALRGPLGKSARAAAGAALVNRKCAAELEHSRPHARNDSLLAARLDHLRDEIGDELDFALAETPRRRGRRSDAQPTGNGGRARIVRHRILVDGDVGAAEGGIGLLAR